MAWLTREMNKTAVTRLVHIAWETVGTIVSRVVARTLDSGRLDNLYVIGIDEVSYRKGQKYLSIIMNHAEGRPVWIDEGRSRQTIGKFFTELGPERAADLEVVTMDMSGPYIAEVQAQAPQAEIAFDPFHVVKLANDAVQKVRREEARDLKGTADADVLKGTRWTLLKAPEALSKEEKTKLARVESLNRRVYRAYLLKEELRVLYQCRPQNAPWHLTQWLKWARRSQIPSFIKLAATLTKHRQGVLDAIKHGVSNGPLESLNGRISMLKHRAFGFHSASALIAMIFLCCTHLPINLPT